MFTAGAETDRLHQAILGLHHQLERIVFFLF
jgi:hypothetical protein